MIMTRKKHINYLDRPRNFENSLAQTRGHFEKIIIALALKLAGLFKLFKIYFYNCLIKY